MNNKRFNFLAAFLTLIFSGLPTGKTLSSFIALASAANSMEEDHYQGSRFSDVWGQVLSDPYTDLPMKKVTLDYLFRNGPQNNIFHDSQRTIRQREDLLPPFNKLLHPLGVCLSGTWRITEKNPYSGFFKQHSEGLIIVRASVALNYPTRGRYRGFGFAGKIYPTMDRNHQNPLKTANFFAIDDVTGTLTPHYTDVGLTNLPQISLHWGTVARIPVGIPAVLALIISDYIPIYRQLYPISTLNLSRDEEVKTPFLIRIKSPEGIEKVDEDDFRNELLGHIRRDGFLSFDIEVAPKPGLFGGIQWSPIGKIHLDEAVASDSCDHRLHFHHPPLRQD